MVTLEQLRQFAAVVEWGTLTAAADELRLSQPALSRSMQRFEREFPASLFNRSANHVTVTPAGLLVAEHARRVLKEVDAMHDAAEDLDRRTRTLDVVSCAPAPVWRLLPALEQAAPGMTVTSRITSLEGVQEAIEAGEFHLAITTRRPSSDAPAFSWGSEHLYLSVPPAHPAAAHASVRLADLDGETMLLVPNLGFWGDLVRERMPRATFLMQDPLAWEEITRTSTLPVFVSDVTATNRVPENRVLVHISDPEANPNYWCVINPAHADRLTPVLHHLTGDANPNA